MEHLDLRDMVADEIEYQKLDPSLIDKTVSIIKNSDRTMSLLDLIVGMAIARAQEGE